MGIKVKKSKEAIDYLISSKDDILTYLKKIVASKKFNYRTFGTTIEEHITDAIVSILTKGEFIKN